ncbi:hypothetical protein KSS87_002623 [Heliosperma pusillum]|nr:hypothetical protein KSS87_002623 [Heliosperma pusillum]
MGGFLQDLDCCDFQVERKMGSKKQTFMISYRSLLSDIAKEMGWVEPIYNQSTLVQSLAYVLLMKSNGPASYSFPGSVRKSVADSEEEAAHRAVEYVVQQNKVIVDDVNLERYLTSKSCSKFYRKKRAALEFVERISGDCSSASPVTCTPRTVNIDFWGIWAQIVAAFEIDVAEVEDMVMANGNHISTFVIKWPKKAFGRVSYFIGETSPTLNLARHSLAKKAISYAQTIYEFRVKDVNYSRVVSSEIICGLHRDKYLAVQKKIANELWPIAVLNEEGCATPQGHEYHISSGLTLPPPPPQKKTFI